MFDSKTGLRVEIKFCGNHKPNAATPDVAAVCRKDLGEHNVFLVARCAAALRAISRFAVNHPHNVVLSNNDSTIETTHADLPDKSTVFRAKA